MTNVAGVYREERRECRPCGCGAPNEKCDRGCVYVCNRAYEEPQTVTQRQVTDTVKRASDRLVLVQKELALMIGAAVTVGLSGMTEPLHRIKEQVEAARSDLQEELPL